MYTLAVCTHRLDRRLEFEAPRDEGVAAVVDVGGITARSRASRGLRITSASDVPRALATRTLTRRSAEDHASAAS